MKKIGIKLYIQYDTRKPNGTPRKILDTRLAKSYGWSSKISLSNGFDNTFKDFLNNVYKN